MSNDNSSFPVKFFDPTSISALGIGPGSQDDGPEKLDYMVMPEEVMTYAAPNVPERDEINGREQAVVLLESVKNALEHWQPGDSNKSFSLMQLSAPERELVDQILGSGEVSVTVQVDNTDTAIQESVLTGVWQVHQQDINGHTLADSLEVGTVPESVRSQSFRRAKPELLPTEQAPLAVLNAPSVLVELADHIKAWQAGDTPLTINLSLLPMSPDDIAWISEVLGTGPTLILSRGYGNCRIGATSYRNTWWIKYFNSQDNVILETLDVCDVPPVAVAAPEDIADSAERLNEILEIYR
ncbi:MAG: hydrogenase expression/formation C-terminal domain-containing protein [Granulosicoccaceae bacterium]